MRPLGSPSDKADDTVAAERAADPAAGCTHGGAPTRFGSVGGCILSLAWQTTVDAAHRPLDTSSHLDNTTEIHAGASLGVGRTERHVAHVVGCHAGCRLGRRTVTGRVGSVADHWQAQLEPPVTKLKTSSPIFWRAIECCRLSAASLARAFREPGRFAGCRTPALPARWRTPSRS
jgi:hypothetical protein